MAVTVTLTTAGMMLCFVCLPFSVCLQARTWFSDFNTYIVYILHNWFSGAVRRNRLLNKPSNAEVENEIKVWLRQSRDCGGGRQARQRAKKNSRVARHESDTGSDD